MLFNSWWLLLCSFVSVPVGCTTERHQELPRRFDRLTRQRARASGCVQMSCQPHIIVADWNQNGATHFRATRTSLQDFPTQVWRKKKVKTGRPKSSTIIKFADRFIPESNTQTSLQIRLSGWALVIVQKKGKSPYTSRHWNTNSPKRTCALAHVSKIIRESQWIICDLGQVA